MKKARLIEKGRKSRVSQLDVPSYPLSQATRVSAALADHFGLKSARPIQVAQALEIQPTSSGFRMLCGAAIAYGLTEGGYNADRIALTQLGKRAVAPTREGDDAAALREAFMRPRVIREFLRRYDGSKLPREDIARNVLVEIGVPQDAADRALTLIVDGARTYGLLREIGGSTFVDLQSTPVAAGIEDTYVPGGDDAPDEALDEISDGGASIRDESPKPTAGKTRVFISHGKNLDIVAQVKTMLNVAEVEYEVAIEEESTAIPVPDKVLEAMRKCNAAIVCIAGDAQASAEGQGPRTVNQNVLIEIGAAFVLYNKNVVLLWDKRVVVPSNLQGLYRCEFEGSELSWSVGMKLMEAVKKFRS
jgi:hypothetical protein